MSDNAFAVLHHSNVNTWDCDENGHLNVRHFIGKNFDGLEHLFAAVGLSREALRDVDARIRLTSQHVRFHAEARVAIPITGRGGVVAASADKLVTYSELRNSLTDALFTTFNSEFEFLSSAGEVIASTTIEPPLVGIPDYGAIRSTHPSSAPATEKDAALAAGYITTGLGVVRAHQCDTEQRLEIFEYSGIVADAITNLMAYVQPPEEFELRTRGELGGAVVESRVDYYQELHAGSRYELLSGVREFSEKTYRLSHLLFDLDRGGLVMHSQAIGVALDLKTRRAVPFTTARKALMQERLLRPA